MKITLTSDQRVYIGCLIENALIRRDLIEYAKEQGVDLTDRPFVYDKETGVIGVNGIARDVVCKTIVETTNTMGLYRSVYGDVVYYFCSEQCLQRFQMNRMKYLES